METESLNWRHVRRPSAVRWGSPTFDALFRAWVGFVLGYHAESVLRIAFGDSLEHRPPVNGLTMFFGLLPFFVLIALGFHWRREFRVRAHVLKVAFVTGFLYTFVVRTILFFQWVQPS